ncbi:MAG: DUF5723 family protein [Bacteroidales bacterium]|nr:DUF5723 family protein [Bacteroidales bacterium]
MKNTINRKLWNRIKIFSYMVIFIFCCSSSFAQIANAEYFMRSSYSKTSLNPALRPERGYIGIPGLSNVFIDYKTNTLNLDHFLFKGVGENGKTGTFLHSNVSYDDFMKNISRNNYLSSDVNVSILDFGMYREDLYISFDASVRANASGNIPEEVFSFLKKGITLRNDEGDTYDFSDISADLNSYMQLGFGASYPFMENSLVIGAKAKILFGLANARFKLDKMQLNIGRDEWTLESQALLQAVYHKVHPEYNEEGYFDGIDIGSGIGFSGFGLGLDLGFTYEPGQMYEFFQEYRFLNNLKISGSFTDIGFIRWNKNKTMFLETDPEKMSVTGNHTISFENNSGNSLENIIDDIGDDFRKAINLKESQSDNLKTSTGLRAKMNWGLEYGIIPGQLNVGVLSSTYFNPHKTLTEFTLGSAYRPIEEIELGLSYSFMYSKFRAFGFAVHFNPGNAFNFFIASDYLFPSVNSDFLPAKSAGINLQVGMAIGFGQLNPHWGI